MLLDASTLPSLCRDYEFLSFILYVAQIVHFLDSFHDVAKDSRVFYRNWLNLQVHLLWCHNRRVAEGVSSEDEILRFTEFTNSAAWLVREGWAEVEHDGIKYRAFPGQWLIVRPGARVQSFPQGARVLSIAFDARWPDGTPLYRDGLSLILDAVDVPELEKKLIPILNMVKKIAPDTWDMRDHHADFASFLRLERLLCEWLEVLSTVLKRHGIRHSGHEGMDERVRQTVEIMQARDFACPFRVEELATELNISSNYLNRIFRAAMRVTPNQYWDLLRIEHARSRLRQPGMRIKEVALDLGFKHLSHFSKWFKRHVGESPQSLKSGAKSKS